MTTVARRAGRTVAAMAVALVVVILSAIVIAGAAAPTARADDSFVAGSGTAIASAIQEGPAASGLSLKMIFGESLAGYISTAAQAQSQTLDIGIWGLLLTAKQCDGYPAPLRQDQVPQPLRADSRDADAAAGKQASTAATSAGSPVQLTAGLEQVKATKDPHAFATTTLAVASLPGVLDVRAGKADTDSGVVGNATRVARATADLGDVDLLGGAIKLRGLRWTARQQTGKDAVNDGSFTIAGAEIGGRALPTGDATAVIKAVNQITSPVGITLGPPQMKNENGVVQVSPLLVRLQASPTQTAAVSPVLGALQPLRQAVIQAVNALTCRVQTAVTVLDVSMGPMTGSGAYDFALGGTSATTEGTRFDNPFATFPNGAGGGLPAAAATQLTSPGSASVLGGGATAGTPGTPGSLSPGATRRRVGSTGLLAGARSLAGSTGGWPVLVGFLAVAGVLAMAGADWWRVRRAAGGDR